MILDLLHHHHYYRAIHSRLSAAFDALQSIELRQASDGIHEIQGRDVFAIVPRYHTKPREQGRWEAHRAYTDVQHVVDGSEIMGWAPVDGLTVVDPYDSPKDILFLDGQGPHRFVTVTAGMMAIFFPQDAHMPGLADGAVASVHKIVVKVRWHD
jgi:biofilm protein TabA